MEEKRAEGKRKILSCSRGPVLARQIIVKEFFRHFILCDILLSS
jgi:hypothetical protein